MAPFSISSPASLGLRQPRLCAGEMVPSLNRNWLDLGDTVKQKGWGEIIRSKEKLAKNSQQRLNLNYISCTEIGTILIYAAKEQTFTAGVLSAEFPFLCYLSVRRWGYSFPLSCTVFPRSLLHLHFMILHECVTNVQGCEIVPELLFPLSS